MEDIDWHEELSVGGIDIEDSESDLDSESSDDYPTVKWSTTTTPSDTTNTSTTTENLHKPSFVKADTMDMYDIVKKVSESSKKKLSNIDTQFSPDSSKHSNSSLTPQPSSDSPNSPHITRKNNLPQNSALRRFFWAKLPLEGDVPCPRRYHTAVVVDSFLWVFGGLRKDYKPLSDLYKLDLDNFRWHKIHATGEIPEARYMHSAASNDRNIYIYGGALSTPALISGELFKLDTDKNIWERIDKDNSPGYRYQHVALSYNHSFMLIFGGYSDSEILDDLYKFDFDESRWEQMKCSGQKPGPRRMHSATILNNCLYTFGGINEQHVYLNDLFVLDLETRQWQKIEHNFPDKSPQPRSSPSLLPFLSQYLLVFAGTNGVLDLDDLWAFDLKEEQWLSNFGRGITPRPREGHSSVWTGTRMIMFGGCSSMTLENDTHILESDEKFARNFVPNPPTPKRDQNEEEHQLSGHSTINTASSFFESFNTNTMSTWASDASVRGGGGSSPRVRILEKQNENLKLRLREKEKQIESLEATLLSKHKKIESLEQETNITNNNTNNDNGNNNNNNNNNNSKFQETMKTKSQDPKIEMIDAAVLVDGDLSHHDLLLERKIDETENVTPHRYLGLKPWITNWTVMASITAALVLGSLYKFSFGSLEN